MLSVFMLPRSPRLAWCLPVVIVLALGVTTCQKVPLLAPSGSVITLTAGANALPVNATTQLIAQVIAASGSPPHSGTQVTFTTNLGNIQPVNAETDVNGQAMATFSAGNANGTATITAISGGASASGSNAVKIAVGTAAVGRVNLVANPTVLPPTGGTTTLTATVFDVNGNPLSSAPVAFSTTAGTLNQTVVSTDKNGTATTSLQTTNQATVTASVGATAGSTTPGTGTGGGGTGSGSGTGSTSGQTSASVTINVAGAPTLVITPPTTAPTSGLPSSYTFAVTAATTNGSVIRDLTVDWGDGSPIQDLGAVTGNAVVSHIYRSPGTFTIRATVTDATGFQVPIVTAVTVNPATIPITLTGPTTPPGVGLPATFTIVPGTLPPGDAIRDVQINWGDGNTQDLGAITASTTISHVFANAQSYLVTATVTDTAGNTSSTSTTVTVITTPNPTVVITLQSLSPSSGHPATATFQVQVTAPTGVGIQDATINWGDGSSQDLGGLSGTITLQHTYTGAGQFSVTVNVKDTLGRTTTGSTSVTIS
jgi:Bacterial Ig-like domain (group 1)/PKD domain